MIALALALVTVGARADNCAFASPFHSLMTTLTNQYCTTSDMTCTTTNCGCSSCCEITPGTCEAQRNMATACGTDRVYNDVSNIRASTATTSNYDSVCCIASPTCASHTCSAGMKKKSSNDNFKCNSRVCSDSECCEADDTRCYGLAIGAAAISCPTGKYYSDSSNGAAATSTTYEDNCCMAVATCSTHTCAAWETTKSGATGTTQCLKGTGTASCGGTCCEDDTTKCKGARMHLSVMGANLCAASEFQDPAKNNVAVSAAADWKSSCCTAKNTCQSFKDYDYAASGAHEMQKPAGVLFAIAGLFALAK